MAAMILPGGYIGQVASDPRNRLSARFRPPRLAHPLQAPYEVVDRAEDESLKGLDLAATHPRSSSVITTARSSPPWPAAWAAA